MSYAIALLLALVTSISTSAFAADENAQLLNAPVNRLDNESLQRGARDFVNYCLTCHSAKYMRYNRLTDLGLTDKQITDNLMFASSKIGDTMTVAMTPENGKAWFGNAPPDLSVEARIRGRDWLYSYLMGFYRDEKAPSGWNNLVFPNVAMPNVLWQLSGVNKLVKTDYEDHERAQAAAIAVKGLVALEPDGEKYSVLQVEPDQRGTMTRAEYEAFVTDLVNYLDYMGEPIRNTRIHLGLLVLLFLGVLFVFAYALKRDYWKELH
ncbi:MAG TPA: cytochrome c1 [Casimicrobiaceae bacterium]|nr:cytochrome c1 [Casimicrobiaceae bacterium]